MFKNTPNYRIIAVTTVVCLAGVSFVWAGPVLPDFSAAVFEPGAPIDNPYRPFIPGTLYTYQGETDEGDLETTKVFVTFDTKEILGVPCTIVQDSVWEEDLLIEDTYDWYAQDTAGNIWYMGEWSTEYEYDDEDNIIGEDHAGSWEAGVDGALPGYLVKGAPSVGDSYYQEYYVGEAEDEAEVISLNADLFIGYGDFHNLLQTFETTALDQEALEYKFYAQGLGLLAEQGLDDQGNVVSTVELISVETIPEPATWTLLALGGLAVLQKRSKKGVRSI